MMDLEDRERRAKAAAAEYKHTAAAFESVRAELIERMLSTSPDHVETVTRLHVALHVLAQVQRAVMTVIDDGKVVEAIAASGLARRF